jgi:hypothetical protein
MHYFQTQGEEGGVTPELTGRPGSGLFFPMVPGARGGCTSIGWGLGGKAPELQVSQRRGVSAKGGVARG